MAGTPGRRLRWGLYVGAVAVLAALSALDPSGLQKQLRLERDARGLRAENARYAAENGQLAREIRALRAEPAALERAVREELRYIRPGERVYWLGAERGGAP
jgi:cell division protein FtsB